MRLSPELSGKIGAIVEDEGLALLATEVLGAGSRMILRLVVEGPEGVGLEACAAISKQVSVLLDVEDPFPHHYTLEVSSPGLDRKFYSESDYRRFSGRRVSIRMMPGFRSVRRCTGQLKALEGGTVCLIDDDGRQVDLPLDQILETRLEIDWSRVMKEGKNNR